LVLKLAPIVLNKQKRKKNLGHQLPASHHLVRSSPWPPPSPDLEEKGGGWRKRMRKGPREKGGPASLLLLCHRRHQVRFNAGLLYHRRHH
jgi:hypothetical protein